MYISIYSLVYIKFTKSNKIKCHYFKCKNVGHMVEDKSSPWKTSKEREEEISNVEPQSLWAPLAPNSQSDFFNGLFVCVRLDYSLNCHPKSLEIWYLIQYILVFCLCHRWGMALFAHRLTIPLSEKFIGGNLLSGGKPEEEYSSCFAIKCLQFQLKCANKKFGQKDKLSTVLVNSHRFLFSCFCHEKGNCVSLQAPKLFPDFIKDNRTHRKYKWVYLKENLVHVPLSCKLKYGRWPRRH